MLRWFKKNSVYLFLLGVFLSGAIVGAMIVAIVNAMNAQAVCDVKVQQSAVPQSKYLTLAQPEKVVWDEYIATAYCSCKKCCASYAENRPVDDDGNEIVYTASGERAVQGITIAADWSVLPAGTVVEIDGYGEFTVHDKGGNITGNKIDIYFESHQEALEWGVKTVKLRVIENGGEKK